MMINNFIQEKTLAPAHLLKLHEILVWMVTNNRMESTEALNILQRAGFKYDSINSVWIDEMGVIYKPNKDIY